MLEIEASGPRASTGLGDLGWELALPSVILVAALTAAPAAASALSEPPKHVGLEQLQGSHSVCWLFANRCSDVRVLEVGTLAGAGSTASWRPVYSGTANPTTEHC